MRPPQKKKRMQPCRKRSKNLEAAKDAASPEKLAEIDDDIAALQEIYDKLVAEAAKLRGPLPAMQANVDAAQARYDEARNRTSGLQAKLDKVLKDLGDEEPSKAISETIKQLRSEIMAAKRQEEFCEEELDQVRHRLESQERVINNLESDAENVKAHIDEDIAKRNALLGDLEKAQAAYDDACKAYEEAKAAADKATSPEVTKPAETTPLSGSTQPAETAQPAGSPATGKDTAPNSAKQANTSSGKQANTTAGKLANTGDTTPSAIALAGIAVAGLGITATATRRLKNSK